MPDGGKPHVDYSANECTEEHAFHAFDALYCSLVRGATPIAPSFANDEYPLFVTWNTRRAGREPRLRGCIGTFAARPVRDGLAEYALVAALRDHRFRPIKLAELPTLECAISLLTDFEDAEDWQDWTVGTHGIHIWFPHPRSASTTLSATYLPQVMPEQGWTKQEAIDSAVHKAGWEGQVTEGIRQSIRLERYQSRKCTVGWDDYVRWRQAHGESVNV